MKEKSVGKLILGIVILALLLACLGYTIYINSKAQAALMESLESPEPTESEEPSPTPKPTPTPTPEPENDLPDIDIDDWEFILANYENDIGDYTPKLATIENVQLDERIIDAMKSFVADARAEGLSVYLSSGYRSYDEQSYLYNRKVSQYGEEVAKTIVAPPGTSEHQTGLSCDITDKYYEVKDSSLENTAMYQWMSQHCQEYGFIVRYPENKEDITNIIYEPWHFRYVGVEAATYIMENDLCLEEFIDLYK